MAFEPKRITRYHVIAAVNRIEGEKIKLNPSTGYEVIIKGKHYPPKEIIRISHLIATGEDPGKIYGGEQTNSILTALKFKVVKKVKVWKLGCNWGKNAPSFYEYIKREEMVISSTDFPFHQGDLVLITEGFTVYAIAQVREAMQPVTYREDLEAPFDELKIDYEEKVLFAPADWHELPKTQIFKYELQQGIREVQSKDIRETAIDIWESRGDQVSDLTIHCRTTEYFPDKNWLFPALVLVRNRWNDYGWSTGYDLFIYRSSSENQRVKIGTTKILQRDKQDTTLPLSFEQLGDEFCSLGQTIEYYKRLKSELPLQYQHVLRALNDSAYFVDIRKSFEKEKGFSMSLQRATEAMLALDEARRIVEEELIADGYKFTFSVTIGKADEEHVVDFEFNQQAELPNRFFCLIGKNGTGKTQFLSSLANKLTDDQRPGTFEPERPGFRSVIAASFSYFDKFNLSVPKDISYHFIGVRNKDGLNDEETMANLVWQAFVKLAGDKDKKDLWLESLQSALEIEYLDFELSELINISKRDEFLERTEGIFSSGQKIIFQFLTRFLSVLDYQSLLLFDEPETHLHPNIAGRLLRAIHKILDRYKSFSILSTHSPIIVQEVPSRYIRIFDRHQNTPIVKDPLIECFGENLSNISNSIFEADQEKEIYKVELERLISVYTLDEIKALFELRLSTNAQVYLQTLTTRFDNGKV